MNDQNNKLEDKGTCSSYRRIRIQIKNQTLKLKVPVRKHPLVYFKTDKDVKRRRKNLLYFSFPHIGGTGTDQSTAIIVKDVKPLFARSKSFLRTDSLHPMNTHGVRTTRALVV